MNDKKNKPKILIWDLETGFNQANIFSLWDTKKGISPEALQSERYIICGSFKWLGEDEVTTYYVNPKDPLEDFGVVADLHAVLNEADAIVAHYGDAYDLKFFNGRAIYHGFDPIHKMVQIDTYKIAKKHFLFNSNRLDYLGRFLGFGGKIQTTRGLWQKCYDGDKEAIQQMVTYCEQDVNLLEQVYYKLRPYTEAKLNMGHFADTDKPVCPTCGSTKVHRRGFYYTRTGKVAKLQCQDCGAWSSERITLKEKPILK